MKLYICGLLTEVTPTGRWYITETGVMGIQFEFPKEHWWEKPQIDYVEEHKIHFPITKFYFNCRPGEY